MSLNKKVIIIVFVLAIVLGFFLYLNKTGQTVTITSQNEAETPQGIQAAAQKAKIKLLEEQAVETAALIQKLKDKEPEYMVQTIVKEVAVVSEQERIKNNADFAIITKHDDPDYKFNPDDFDKDDVINLNQYNIKAYKKRIVGVSYYPNKFASIDYSKKVSNSGHYLGISVIQDLKENKSYFGVRYSF